MDGKEQERDQLGQLSLQDLLYCFPDPPNNPPIGKPPISKSFNISHL